MPSTSFRATIDETNKIVTFRVIGDLPSRELADRIIGTLRQLASPWTYSRILDARRYTGVIEPADADRIMNCWQGMDLDPSIRSKAAVVRRDSLTAAKTTVYRPIFPNTDLRSFNEMREALDWITAA